MYLIDGNNLAGRRAKNFPEKERKYILEALAEFAKKKGTRVSVVFDGAPVHNYPEGSSFQGVKIYYAQKGTTADSRIRQLIEQSRTPRQCTVVTADRELQNSIRIRQGKILHPKEFYRQLENLRAETTPSPDELGLNFKDGEVDDWLRYFGVDSQDDSF